MNITFIPLTATHFPLLLKWLESPHVKKWFDKDVKYTLDTVQKKYGDYINGYKFISATQSIPIQAYIICLNDQSIGYIQLYKAYDFPKNNTLMGLPENLAAIDIFIGEESYLSKNIGFITIKTFLDQYVFLNYKYVFVDPEYTNTAAVRAFEKAGFVILNRFNKTFWMIGSKKLVRLSIRDCVALEVAFRTFFLPKDHLWIFGSRANLAKKGGDLDIYIETHAQTIDTAITMQLRFISNLKQVIGDQKIDVILNVLNTTNDLPIYQIAKTEGVNIL